MKKKQKVRRLNPPKLYFTKKENKDVADKISIDKIGCMMVIVWFVMLVAFLFVHLKYS